MKLLFGKYNKREFADIYINDKNYCKWVSKRYHSVEDKSILTKSFTEFAQYIEKRDDEQYEEV